MIFYKTASGIYHVKYRSGLQPYTILIGYFQKKKTNENSKFSFKENFLMTPPAHLFVQIIRQHYGML